MTADSKSQNNEAIHARWKGRAGDFLGLERNTAAAAATIFLLGFGEEMWKKFLPKYLEALGAGPLAIGLFGTAKDFFDAIYQYPGGWLADRVGRRRAFYVFIALASLGYIIYLISFSWSLIFLGLALASGWQSMASPAIFAIIGDSLPVGRRTMGFTFQAILRRVPMMLAPLVGAVLIARLGITSGIRASLIITLLLASVAALVVRVINIPVITGDPVNIKGVWNSFHYALKRLLLSDVVIRTCEGLAEVLIILYVTNIIGIGVAQYGVLVAVQMMASILVYVPAAKISDRWGRKPFVIATFCCFALFPVAVALSKSFASLIIAFIIGGLREIGEPSRKALIVDMAQPHLRARTVGLYYLIRSLIITPAAALGGLLWQIAPQAPFIIAGVVGLIGVVIFAATVEERHAA